MFNQYTGLAENSKGGTEQMYQRLWNSLSEENRNTFQIICSRINKFEDGKIPVFWAHDLAQDSANTPLKNQAVIDKIAGFIFVSDWQRAQYEALYNIPRSRSFIIPNAVQLLEPDDNKSVITDATQQRVNFIYHTTPHRGLEILVPVFLNLLQDYPMLHLDVFSSFEIYGWGERDSQYKNLIDICRNHSNIKYHGTVDNSVIRKTLLKTHVFAYPNIWPETSCLAAIEALVSGTHIICPDHAALGELMGYSNQLNLYRYQEDKRNHAAVFECIVRDSLDDPDRYINLTGLKKKERLLQSQISYDWKNREIQWNNALDLIKNLHNDSQLIIYPPR